MKPEEFVIPEGLGALTRVQLLAIRGLIAEAYRSGWKAGRDAFSTQMTRIAKDVQELPDPPQSWSDDEKPRYTPVETMRVSPRTLGFLINNDIGSIEELRCRKRYEIERLKGCVKNTMKEIDTALVQSGHLPLE